MQRIILHSDMNNFYANVECIDKPWLRDVPMIVGGSRESRHGIVLSKNELAKKLGVKTGQVLWEAEALCGNLVKVEADFSKYHYYSGKAREIYDNYSDKVEAFGLDECWLDVSEKHFDYGIKVAQEIRRRMKDELNLTVSIGVSFNKVFAKLGSDMKKPDAVTVISRENYRTKAWQAPACDLLYVGPKTKRKLELLNIKTIGDLANADIASLEKIFGKHGRTIYLFANGQDMSAVKPGVYEHIEKGISNSTPLYRDLASLTDVKIVFTMLAESVVKRMRARNFKCQTVSIWIRDKNLSSFTRQIKLKTPTSPSTVILDTAMELFAKNYTFKETIRSLGISCTDWADDNEYEQISLSTFSSKPHKMELLEITADNLRRRYDKDIIIKGTEALDSKLASHPEFSNFTNVRYVG